jgi:hypothetical protein
MLLPSAARPSGQEKGAAQMWAFHSRICAWGSGLALLTFASVTSAVPIGVPARKLIVIDKLAAADRAKIVFLAKDSSIEKGDGTDVNDIAVHLEVVYDSARGSFVVPRGGSTSGGPGWTMNTARVARYENTSAPDGPSDTRVAVVKPGRLLKLAGRALGEVPLDILAAGPPQGEVSVAYCVENGGDTICHCSRFPHGTCAHRPVADGTGAKLVCRRGVGEASCSGTIPDLSGFWLLEQTGGNSTCLTTSVPPFESNLNLYQAGTSLTGSGAIWSYSGTASVTDFHLSLSSIPPLLSCFTGPGVYEATLSIEGDLPLQDGVVPVTQTWAVFPLLFDPACPPCSVTWTGTMELAFASSAPPEP